MMLYPPVAELVSKTGNPLSACKSRCKKSA